MSKHYTHCLIFLFLFFIACNNPQANENPGELKEAASQTGTKEHHYEVRIYEVKGDSVSAPGWGYDILVDKEKVIHQPAIPAIPGIHPFKTKDDAYKTAIFAADKLRLSGTLPTLTIHELDSLGVIPSTNP